MQYPETFLDHKGKEERKKEREASYNITEGRGIQFEDGEDERFGMKPIVEKTGIYVVHAERSLRDFVRNNHQPSLTHNNVASILINQSMVRIKGIRERDCWSGTKRNVWIELGFRCGGGMVRVLHTLMTVTLRSDKFFFNRQLSQRLFPFLQYYLENNFFFVKVKKKTHF